MEDAYNRRNAQFPSTHWSAVAAAGESDSERGKAALEGLLRRYQFAIKSVLMERFRCTEHKAEDLFQGFVLDTLLKNRLLARAREAAGYQFRSFLLGALNNYVVSEFRKENAQKRQPAEGLMSMDELVEQSETIMVEAAPQNFDVVWARGVLAETLSRMERECTETGQSAIWGVFEERLRRPILEGAEVTPYEELVKRLGFTMPAQARRALFTAKEMFARALRSVVAEYAHDQVAIEVEVRELQLILQHSREGEPGS
jgi:DNA-directed RNA polymerase specialized sigma24 family protein